MLKSILRKQEVAVDPLDSIRADLAAAVQEQTVASEALGAAAVSRAVAPEDPAKAKAYQEAQKRAADAASNVAGLQAALASMERAGSAREALEASRKAKDELAKRWNTTESHCKTRSRAAADVEAAAGQLFKAYRVLAESSAVIWDAKVVTDEDGGLLRPNALENELRITLAKAGFKWAASKWPWPLEDREGLSTLITKANTHILNQKAAA